MVKKEWRLPSIILLHATTIHSSNLQTNMVFEAINFTLQNTCTFNGADCMTGDGVVYYISLPSGYSMDAFGVGNPGTLSAGTVSTCYSALQCS